MGNSALLFCHNSQTYKSHNCKKQTNRCTNSIAGGSVKAWKHKHKSGEESIIQLRRVPRSHPMESKKIFLTFTLIYFSFPLVSFLHNTASCSYAYHDLIHGLYIPLANLKSLAIKHGGYGCGCGCGSIF